MAYFISALLNLVEDNPWNPLNIACNKLPLVHRRRTATIPQPAISLAD